MNILLYTIYSPKSMMVYNNMFIVHHFLFYSYKRKKECFLAIIDKIIFIFDKLKSIIENRYDVYTEK